MKTTKRFLLTLAAMISMTGAWAQDTDCPPVSAGYATVASPPAEPPERVRTKTFLFIILIEFIATPHSAPSGQRSIMALASLGFAAWLVQEPQTCQPTDC